MLVLTTGLAERKYPSFCVLLDAPLQSGVLTDWHWKGCPVNTSPEGTRRLSVVIYGKKNATKKQTALAATLNYIPRDKTSCDPYFVGRGVIAAIRRKMGASPTGCVPLLRL